MSQTKHPKRAETITALSSFTPEPPSRRAFLFTGVTGAALSLGSLMALAQQAQAMHTGPATGRTQQLGCAISDQLFGIHNVKCFGAKGDDSPGDKEAVDAAVAALNPGGVLYFPPGVYLVPAGDALVELSDKSDVVVQGAGPATVLQMQPSGGLTAGASLVGLRGHVNECESI